MLKFVRKFNEVYTIAAITGLLDVENAVLPAPDARIQTLCYDSRKLTNPARALFFALTGRKDGHTYLREVYKAGVRNFVVQQGRVPVQEFPDANILPVDDTLAALQQLAAAHRRRFDYPVIGITGSNGKTIVKEWLWQLLSPEYRIVRSPKSYNSQLGVPLSLWQMDERHNLAIIEAGISKPGEMDLLERMIAPSVGILTNIGPAHDDGFASRAEKTAEKLRLFKKVSTLICPANAAVGQTAAKLEQITWGKEENAVLRILRTEVVGGRQCLIEALYKGQHRQVVIPFADAASADNAACCWSVLLAMGYDQPVIESRMALLQPLSMRLELKSGLNNCSVLDDSYSNDLASLRIALDFLSQQQQHQQRVLILSDLPGETVGATGIYGEVAALVREKGIGRFVGVGPVLQRYAGLFGSNSLFFPDTQSLADALPSLAFRDATILLKGARHFGFEEISRRLTAQLHETVMEINLNAVEQNLNYFRGKLAAETRLMVMVKAFSYGSGSYEIANLLQFHQVDYLTVAYADEGIALRRAGIDLPIVVMSPGGESLKDMLMHGLEPEIYSFTQLEQLLQVQQEAGLETCRIHLKVNTGMNRLGFEPDDLPQLLEILGSSDRVQVQSVFSHLAAAGDSRHDAFTASQLSAFEQFTDGLKEGLGYSFLRHIANTAAISRWPGARYDMVRLGIGLYGVAGGDRLPLATVATLKTSVAQVREVKAGESIGYNRHGKLERDGRIATVRIGYADGYNRHFGNGAGTMLLQGKPVRTVGDICMDMCMLDVSGMDVQEGEEVIVFGDTPSVTDLSEHIGTIPYELLATVSQRVKRIYYYE